MMRWIIRIALGVCVVAVAAITFAWSVLAVPYFSDFRSALVSELLSDQLGQPVFVNGDVSVVMAPISRVRASAVQIPSENMADLDLARLNTFAFDVDLFKLLDGRVDLNNLVVDGLKVELIKTPDETTSWSERENKMIATKRNKKPSPENDPAQTDGESSSGILAFLRTRTVAFTDIQLIVDDQVTGFEYDFELKELSLAQLDEGSTLGIIGRGQVNGQPFELDGNFPDSAPFTTSAKFSSADLTFNGDPISIEEGGGYTGQLALDVESVNDLLEVLKLKGSIDGRGSIRATVTKSGSVTSVFDIGAALNLEKGQLISLNGKIDNLNELDGFDLQFDARLHPENQPPTNAQDLKDLKLTNISTQIISQDNLLELEELLLVTNAFQQGLDEVGPVAIGRIRRTEEGTLALQDITLQAGPRDRPILVARGNIENVLELKNLSLAGEIDAPASLVLSGLNEGVASEFGGIEAEFMLDDRQGALSLSNLTVKAVDTDVWTLDANMKVGDVTSLEGALVDIALGIQNGAAFFEALDLDPIETGSLGLGIALRGEGGLWKGELDIGAGTSELTATVETSEEAGRQKITAAITSESMVLADLKNALAGVKELRKIGNQPKADLGSGELELQPLVLPETDEVPIQPTDTETDMAIQPLVVATSGEDKILDGSEFLRETDIYGIIDFREILGIEGITRVSSDFESVGGKARLGPLEFNYGGGFFNFEAAMDVVEAPKYVSVSGATSGWNLSQILAAAGVEFDASGGLSGRFTVAGNLTSVETFVNSMTGSASVSMSRGKVATSLLELAGLGIFPWLFSEELRQGYTDVVCVNAPVRITAGVVSFDAVVAETESVQMVARGNVDWVGDSVAIRAEPRAVGRPLSRSAWPFDVTGKLSDPRFKLDIGGSRSRRTDGANQMPANRQPCQPDILQLQ
ncbi:hypothetical protein SuNHUV7_30910 (plasmid) [Pseudoseohaeicola sp. NH-UV-7]|uniref:AsmA family protein n=1 Tax=Sulfitobacter sp. TBRI5 TaxID=2989732 RepID=UPI003A5EC05C